MLEICIDSLESALNAVHGGADELEVCSSLPEGGLTPTAGLVQEIINAVNEIAKEPLHKTISAQCSCILPTKKPKINVMLRCRPGSDFQYNSAEMKTMLSDLSIFKAMKVDRFVFGALSNGEIDIENCSKVIQAAGDIPVTFHRAFDVCKNPEATLEKVIKLGFTRILTSGQQLAAVDPKAINLIKKLLSISDDRIEVMPGSGINDVNVQPLVEIGCKIFHGSCKKVKALPNVGLAMGAAESDHIYVADFDSVRKLKNAVMNKCSCLST